MTIDEANEIVAALTYKPGWEIELSQRGPNLVLRLTAQVPDSTTAEHAPIQVTADQQIDPYLVSQMSEAMLVNWMFDEILRLERHEAQEWFRLRGALVDDPHAND